MRNLIAEDLKVPILGRFCLEGLKVERPLSQKLNIEVKPMISDGHLKFCTTTYNLWMVTVKQRSYQQLS